LIAFVWAGVDANIDHTHRHTHLLSELSLSQPHAHSLSLSLEQGKRGGGGEICEWEIAETVERQVSMCLKPEIGIPAVKKRFKEFSILLSNTNNSKWIWWCLVIAFSCFQSWYTSFIVLMLIW
jgi:hypothetical protein